MPAFPATSLGTSLQSNIGTPVDSPGSSYSSTGLAIGTWGSGSLGRGAGSLHFDLSLTFDFSNTHIN